MVRYLPGCWERFTLKSQQLMAHETFRKLSERFLFSRKSAKSGPSGGLENGSKITINFFTKGVVLF